MNIKKMFWDNMRHLIRYRTITNMKYDDAYNEITLYFDYGIEVTFSINYHNTGLRLTYKAGDEWYALPNEA